MDESHCWAHAIRRNKEMNRINVALGLLAFGAKRRFLAA